MSDPSALLRTLLLQELHRAVATRIDDGTDPAEVSADLAQRLRRMQQQDRRLHRTARKPGARLGLGD